MPSAAAAAGAGNGNSQAGSQAASDNGVAGGAVSPAAAAGNKNIQASSQPASDNGMADGAVSPAAAPAADVSPGKQSAPESSHPQPSQPSMDITADADGSKARQVSWLALPSLTDRAGRGCVALSSGQLSC